MRAPAAWLAAAVVAVAAGCGSGHGQPSASVSSLPKLVLQPADVPRLSPFDVGRITRFDVPEGSRSDPSRYGRLDGWKADYKRAGGTDTAGPLFVHSEVNLFGSAGAARKDLAAYREQFDRAESSFGGAVRQLEAPHVGDDSAGIVQRQAGKPTTAFITVAWIDGSISASVTVSGVARRLQTADAVGLARVQERRIAAASG